MRRTHSAPDMEKFRSILRTKGLKATPQRLAVHKAMLSMVHASADMVRDSAWKEGTAITLASVYNILDQLCALGIYKKLPSSGGKAWYDVLTGPHIHIYDRKREEIKDLEDGESLPAVSAWFKEHQPKGYRIDDIEIRLICHRSRKSNKTKTI
jgi:Fe2+ or Zn2+ uptake regulation protein